jgi:phosphate:Na+ symporter
MDVGKYAPVLLLIGLVLQFFTTHKQRYHTGVIVFYFGLLFFGLFTIENAVVPLRNQPFFTHWLQQANHPATGILYGGLITLIIQSSSATVGMAIVLAKKGLLTLPAGIAIMMGAELGTCSDTLLATIRGSRAALKTGLFHLLFNLLCVCVGLLLFKPFVGLIGSMGTAWSTERNIANAHLLFNGIGVLLFGSFIPFFEKLLNKLLPDKMPVTGA